ncbi:MAG: exodeoxyribonuclease VII large subunit [Bacteroidales bacterium]|nr:exodeoxyribonuclease VII large subunit [Bacteroidales bacterium]
MPETIGNRKIFSLSEVTRSIEKTLSDRYTSSFWVKAELLKLNHYPRSGHCYPDLVEKTGGRVVAQIRSYLWKNDYEAIRARFISVTKEPLKDGINILFCARVKFDPVHGIALQILDIDPQYTLGDMMREKMEAVARLMAEGVFNRNKNLPFPLLPKRVAVISVETSKGYSDFKSKIENNPFGYSIFHMLFPSLLQGENAVAQLRVQLERIRKVKHHFDVVAIIRGGGGDVGLNCYDNYSLAHEIALFPLPVLTGIGHSTNETVVQMVAHSNNITPTDVADFLIQRFHNFAVPLKEWMRQVADMTPRLIQDKRQKMLEPVTVLNTEVRKILQEENSRLAQLRTRMELRAMGGILLSEEKILSLKKYILQRARENLRQRKGSLNEITDKVRMLDPENILKRGYSITYLNGKALTGIGNVSEGMKLETRLATGMIISIVETKKNTL